MHSDCKTAKSNALHSFVHSDSFSYVLDHRIFDTVSKNNFIECKETVDEDSLDPEFVV